MTDRYRPAQANRTSAEACHVASLLMTKAATDLKMARSLVRLAEIQATLQEQRLATALGANLF